MRVVVALGGNALLERGFARAQFVAAADQQRQTLYSARRFALAFHTVEPVGSIGGGDRGLGGVPGAAAPADGGGQTEHRIRDAGLMQRGDGFGDRLGATAECKP